jgi:hypothetical protein
VATGSFSATPTPAHAIEAEGSPEQIGGEIDGTPELDAGAPAAQALVSDGGDEGFSMHKQASVATYPDNKATDNAIVRAPEDVADQVGVVVARHHSALLVGSDVGGGWKPADTLSVDAR